MHSKITKIYGQMCLLGVGLAFDIFITLRKKEWKNTEDCNDYIANNLVVFLFFKILLLYQFKFSVFTEHQAASNSEIRFRIYFLTKLSPLFSSSSHLG